MLVIMSRFWGARGWVLGLITCAACLLGGAATANAANVSFRLTGGGRTVPSEFFGLSMEYNSLATYQGMGPLFKRAVSLFRAENGAPMILRVGGKSADHVYWDPKNVTSPPKNSWRIGTPWIDNLVDLVKGDNMKVMLDLNLAVHSPTMETAFAVAARKALPGRLMGVEIGNEPDLYKNQPWLSKERISTTTDVHGKWPLSYSYPQYHRDWLVYARALRRAIHGISLGGPETISSKLQYIQAVQDDGSLNANFVTIHRYPSSSCWPRTSPYYPTINMMLGGGAAAGLANTVAKAVSLAHSHHQALRLTEVNSISCGGNEGVADTFATALWAPDALLNMVKVGVDSVNWHIQPDLPNSPFHPTSRGLVALPEMYGLSLFGQMMKPGATLLNSSTSNSSDPSVSIWAVRFKGGMRVLVINKSDQPAWSTLNVGHHNSAYVRTLRARSVSSSSGETFGGQHISDTGHWTGHVRSPSVPYSGGAYHVYVSKYSAALLTFWR
jgi:hypothetical protein